MSETTSFLHDGTIGDCIASLPVVRENFNKTGKRAIYYLTSGQKAEYYEGATHPTKDADGNQCMLNDQMINMMIPLFKAQPYIEDCKIHNGEPIHVDLNMVRQTFVNMPNHMLSRWYFFVFPDLACDLSTEYISVPETDKDFAKGKIIVTRTERYQNENIEYFFLKPYEKDLVFSGTKKEYNVFCMNNDLEIPRLEINDFLELSQALKQSKGLLSNQTMLFQIAEGLKIPRAVELCYFAPNVTPIGKQAYDYYNQMGLEYYFHEFNGTMDEFVKQIKDRALKKPAEAGLTNSIIDPVTH